MQLLRGTKKNKTQDNYIAFKTLRKETKLKVTQAYRSFLHRMNTSIRSDPKTFWSFINTKRNSDSIPSDMTYNDVHLSCPKDVVNAFADHFAKSFALNNNPAVNLMCSSINVNTLNIGCISEENVYKAIQKLKPKLTSGPDQIPAFIVRDCASVFTKPLTVLFNLSLKTCIFPSKWKLSRISPVFKKDNKSNILNYRPIAIINNFAKVFETVLHTIFSYHILHMLSPNQHGFIKGRSTETNLLSLTQFLHDSLDDQRQVDVIYTDFSKAFDTIDHALLLQKLEWFGFSNSLILLLASYLHDRYLFVKINGFQSELFKQETGVPQGSVLGPLLFNIFINDLVKEVEVRSLLFADDLKIYRVIDSYDDALQLQNCIAKVVKWCINNNLSLNISKCYVMTFTKKVNPILFKYNIDGTILVRPEVIRDLGVVFDPKLTFTPHVQFIIECALRSLGFVLRNGREFSDIETLKTLFVAFCRSRLEYVSLVWSPAYNVHITALERVQRKFLKSLCFNIDGFYPPQGYPEDMLLDRFNMQSLHLRRAEHSVLLLFKIIHGIQDCPDILSNINFKVNRMNARNKNTFYTPTTRTNSASNSPLIRMLCSFGDVENELDIFNCTVRTIKQCFKHDL